jgi:hypothetical protein
MKSETFLRSAKYYISVVVLLALVSLASAQSTIPVASNQVTMTLDQDLITFFKWAVSIGAFFLLVFAGTGVLFFGWDVTKTRNALFDARDDIGRRLAEVHRDHAALKELKEKLEQLGGELEEQIAKKGPTADPAPAVEHGDVAEVDEPGPSDVPIDSEETLLIRRVAIRKAIKNSKFTWTTIGTIQRRTGFSREAIVNAVANDGGIVISTGSSTKDLIFKLTEDYQRETGLTSDQVQKLLEEHAARGREPVKGSIYG